MALAHGLSSGGRPAALQAVAQARALNGQVCQRGAKTACGRVAHIGAVASLRWHYPGQVRGCDLSRKGTPSDVPVFSSAQL